MLAAVALGVSLLTVLSMARLWEEAFWKPAPAADHPAAAPIRRVLVRRSSRPIAFLVCLTLGLTLAAGPVYRVATRAAEQLLDTDGYVRAVLGEGVPRAAR